MNINIDEMFRLLLGLQSDTVLLKREQSPSNYVEWVRESDGSFITWPERSMVDDLQTIGLLVTETIKLKDGQQAIRYKLSDKANRIIKARESRNPTHQSPYLGEKCWLVVHIRHEYKEVYPYLGATPPDLSQLLPPEWEPQEYVETFTVRGYSTSWYLYGKDVL